MRPIIIGGFLFVALTVAQAAPPNFVPTFSPRSVPAVVTQVNGSGNLHFGYVTVPEDRSDPSNFRVIQLAVAVLEKDAGRQSANMTVYLAGGPGGSGTLRGLPTFFRNMAAIDDVVLLDQRGTGFSIPNLSFRPRETTPAARARFAREGVNLAAINSKESAFDVEDVRRALGYARMNVVGGSYGTFLTQQVNRFVPQNIRCSVLIGNIAPTKSQEQTFGPDYQQALEALFHDVARTPPARRAYPQLKRKTYALIDRLNRAPLTTTLRDPDSGKMVPVKITGSFLIGTLQTLLEVPQGIRNAPFLIHELGTRGTTRAARKLLTSPPSPISYELLVASGMYNSVWAQEFRTANFRAYQLAIVDRLNEALRGYFRSTAIYLAQDLDAWNLPINLRGTGDPVRSAIPSFFVNGAMDTQTGSQYGAIGAQGYSRGFNFVFPRNGHHVGEEYEGVEMNSILAFLRNPEQPPAIDLTRLQRTDFYRVRPVHAELDRLSRRVISVD